MDAAAKKESRQGHYFDSFEALENALINLVRWPENGEGDGDWKIRCKKLETGEDRNYGRFVCITGVGGDTRYFIYEKLSLDREDPRKLMYSWEHFRDASVLLEMLVMESATIFGGSMKLIMKWLSDNAEAIIEDTKFSS